MNCPKLDIEELKKQSSGYAFDRGMAVAWLEQVSKDRFGCALNIVVQAYLDGNIMDVFEDKMTIDVESMLQALSEDDELFSKTATCK